MGRSGLLLVWILGVPAVAIVAVACSTETSDGATGETLTAPRQSTIPLAPVESPAPDSEIDERLAQYDRLVDRSLSVISNTAQLLSGVGLQLSRSPGDAQDLASTVETAISTFGLIEDSLTAAPAPPGRENVRESLFQSVRSYREAATHLLPDAVTGKADFWSFQPLFQRGGENYHAAGAAFAETVPAP